jgi:hypothetical protein
VAAYVLWLRANDGGDVTCVYNQPNVAGVWQRTPPAFLAPIGIELPPVTPFARSGPGVPDAAS